MNVIEPKGDIGVCFAVDDNYAPYLKVTIKSLLCNRNRNLEYDILIIDAGISPSNKESVSKLMDGESKVCIRFIDVSAYEESVKREVTSYLSVATNYRLLLFSELFSKYDKILYLDTDVIVTGDVSELFLLKIGSKYVAACEEVSFRFLGQKRKPLFIDGKQPYNVDNYRTVALGMKHPKEYFNAGVLLLNLRKCREAFTFQRVINLLQAHKYMYNDQDVLNILMDGKVYKLGIEWNYQNCIEYFAKSQQGSISNLYKMLMRKSPGIIHYVGKNKPWSLEVELSEYYSKYSFLI